MVSCYEMPRKCWNSRETFSLGISHLLFYDSGNIQKSLRNVRIGFDYITLEKLIQSLFTGPTVLEVFNTLLKHLRLSVEFEANDLQGGSVGSVNLNSSSKDNDEKIVQNAIIQTIGE